MSFDAAADVAVGPVCIVCFEPVPAGSTTRVSGEPACPACADKASRENAELQLGARHLPTAALFGTVAAVLCALVWTAVVALASLELGFLAILVGFAVGHAVRLGARNGRSPVLQGLAVALSVFGLVLAKLFIVAWLLHSEAGLPLFSTTAFEVFPEAMSELLTPHDALWLGLAVFAAWRAASGVKREQE
jgi:hypothetical protein